MEKERKSQRATETDFVLQWGTKKRLRCVKVKKDQNLANKSKPIDSLPKKKLTTRIVTVEKESPSRVIKNADMSLSNRKPSALSPEKEDRCYTTRGSLGLDENGKVLMDSVKEEKRFVWPKLFITLSSKEKEEDFMAMKGCKPPQRPKKRAKLIQRTLLLVSPGAWLTDLCQERYEVREKNSSKKKGDLYVITRRTLPPQSNSLNGCRLPDIRGLPERPRGLKAMGSMESDSD